VGYALVGHYPPRYSIFSPAYIPRNLYYLLLHGFRLDFGGEYSMTHFHIDLLGASLLHASPFVLVSLFARIKEPLVAAAWAAVISGALAACSFAAIGFLQINCQRYAFDYIPLLFFLCFHGYRVQAERGQRTLWKGAICWSVALNILVMGLLEPANQALGVWTSWFAR
jgi:hypothetical protein